MPSFVLHLTLILCIKLAQLTTNLRTNRDLIYFLFLIFKICSLTIFQIQIRAHENQHWLCKLETEIIWKLSNKLDAVNNYNACQEHRLKVCKQKTSFMSLEIDIESVLIGIE